MEKLQPTAALVPLARCPQRPGNGFHRLRRQDGRRWEPAPGKADYWKARSGLFRRCGDDLKPKGPSSREENGAFVPNCGSVPSLSRIGRYMRSSDERGASVCRPSMWASFPPHEKMSTESDQALTDVDPS